MKSLFFSVAILALYSTSASALTLKCNPTKGSNWNNASPLTCPFDSGGQSPRARPEVTYVPIHECSYNTARKRVKVVVIDE